MTTQRRALPLAAVLALIICSTFAAVALPRAAPARAATATHPVLGIAAGGLLQYKTAAQQEAYLSAAHDLGATWLRFDFAWTNIQHAGPGTYDWARYDHLVAAAQAHGLQVLGMIGYAPSWARDPACASQQNCRPSDPAQYGAFAGQVARRYASRGVHYWEIWNEPNFAQFFEPAADPAGYTDLLVSAYSAIHAADPQAKVVTGGMAPAASGNGSYAPAAFVAGMYAAGAHGHFDILGDHPYCYEGHEQCPDTSAAWSAWSQMSRTPTSLHGLLASHGDGAKQIWATEFGAPTSGGSSSVSEQLQSSMLVDGVRTFAGYSWGGTLFIYSLQDLGTNHADREDWFGVLRQDGSRKPAYTALQAMMRQAGVAGASSSAGSAKTTPGTSAGSATPSPSASAGAPSASASAAASTITMPPLTATAPAATPAPQPQKHHRPSWWKRLWHKVF